MQGCDAHLMRLDDSLRGIRAVAVEDVDVAVERRIACIQWGSTAPTAEHF